MPINSVFGYCFDTKNTMAINYYVVKEACKKSYLT